MKKVLMMQFLSLDDFERAGEKHLPRMILGYVAGSVETGAGLTEAKNAFKRFSLVPRLCRDISQRSLKHSFLGEEFSFPFGIAPVGGAAMIAYRGDIELAKAAKEKNIPFIMSASSLIKLEDVIAVNEKAWFQAYLAGDEARILPMIKRVELAGFKTLVVTVDLPVLSNREHNVRNGFSMPMRITPRVAWQSITHPKWLFGTIGKTFIKHGMPHYENMESVQGPPMFAQNAMRNFNHRDKFTWAHIEFIRQNFNGRLVVKGLLHPKDVKKANKIGVDAVVISSHGGRQLDYAIPPILALADCLEEKGKMEVYIDSGFRRGTDVLKALILGADGVFLGRPFIYAAALQGAKGVGQAIDILKSELDTDLALIGANSVKELSKDMLIKS